MHFDVSSLLGLTVLLLVGLVIAIVLMTGYTIRVLTHPPRRTYASALARGRPGDPGELDPGPNGKRKCSSWNLRWNNLDLPVWDIEGDKPDGPVMILSHGWGDSRIGGLTRVPALAAFASRLILWDMPGHGEARGSCSLGTRETGALFELIEHVDEPVVLYGWSLGAGVSIAVATVSPGVTGLIAEAPYRLPSTPARNVFRVFGLPWRVNLPFAMGLLGIRFGVGPRWRGFDRLALAAKLTVPYAVLHGDEDEVCPVQDGSQIASASPMGVGCLIKGAGHHSLWTDPSIFKQCADAVGDLLARVRVQI